MRIPSWINNVLGVLYVLTAPVVTILVDHQVLSLPESIQITGAIAVFAAGFHGSQFVSSVKASPVGKIVATLEHDAPVVLAALTPLSANTPDPSTLNATQPVTVDPTGLQPSV